jgi:hypothetical protein
VGILIGEYVDLLRDYGGPRVEVTPVRSELLDKPDYLGR